MRRSPSRLSVAMCRSLLSTSTSASTCRSPARTSPLPRISNTPFLGPSPNSLSRTCFRFSTISVTSSMTPGSVENSCSTPSMRTDVIDAPCSDDRSTRRSALPSVVPKPRSSGSSVNLPYRSELPPSATSPFGIWRFFHFICKPPSGMGRRSSLRVELDDQLFVDRHADGCARRHVQDPARQSLGMQLEPVRHALPLAGIERVLDHGHLTTLLTHLHLVPGTNLERGNVDIAAVHREVAVTDELARRAARRREPQAEHDVVQATLQHLQQDLARDALGLARLGERVPELALQQPVDAASLL